MNVFEGLKVASCGAFRDVNGLLQASYYIILYVKLTLVI